MCTGTAQKYSCCKNMDRKVEVAAKRLFRALDQDFDEFLVLEEFLQFAKNLFDNEQRIEEIQSNAVEIIDLADRNNDGKLNMKEWLELIHVWDYPEKLNFLQLCRADVLPSYARQENHSEAVVREEQTAISKEIFEVLDADATGKVDLTELTILSKLLDLESAAVALNALDLDNDGVITLQEWQSVLLKNTGLSEAQFFEELRGYKHKIKKIQLETLKQEASSTRTQLADTRLQNMVDTFMKTNGCELPYTIRSISPQCAMVIYSQPSNTSPVPSVCFNVLICTSFISTMTQCSLNQSCLSGNCPSRISLRKQR